MMRSIFVLTALAACDVSTTDNFQNPPPGPPDDCTQIDALPGCENGSVSYSCTTYRPDYCDGCGQPGIELHQGPNLVCDAGTPGPTVGGTSSTLFCCAPYGTYDSDCVSTTEIAGCTGSSFGISCTGEIAPSDAAATLTCGNEMPGTGGAKDYCCTSSPPAATCAYDATVTACTGVAIGYTCAGAAPPFEGDPSLACTEAATSGSGASYCCIPFAQSADTCHEDAAVTGCGAGDYRFTCANGDQPMTSNPLLTCSAGTGGSGGAAYCCRL
ncbi:MAG TPA: hypothetical protein VMJ10_00395 [Kofleriaceae bacterium]|nr:hypothetical protein [Kofleriaceae bacterium]